MDLTIEYEYNYKVYLTTNVGSPNTVAVEFNFCKVVQPFIYYPPHLNTDITFLPRDVSLLGTFQTDIPTNHSASSNKNAVMEHAMQVLSLEEQFPGLTRDRIVRRLGYMVSMMDLDDLALCGNKLTVFVYEISREGREASYDDYYYEDEDEYEDGLTAALVESMEDGDVRNYNTATKSSIEKLERVVLNDIADSSRSCTICIKEMEVGMEVIRMPCLHLYHEDCIVEWLEKYSHSCPLCRYEMPVEQERF
ncbi:uncharacterized protein LOC126680685 [Mercurialis annua]|uniref:uncharacterized protein LOC126680685 n=1 Tax=Mercurialis annua TaxID=3986 RepID=UPI00215E995E|nr:uncharacterized protein LOC126680685 [Mercurialis annua]